MSRYRPLPPDPRAREKAVEITRAAGRMGATRVPDSAWATVGLDASDTAVHALLVALDEGQLVRRETIEARAGYAEALAEEMRSTPEAV